jgi:hypothetical protein
LALSAPFSVPIALLSALAGFAHPGPRPNQCLNKAVARVAVPSMLLRQKLLKCSYTLNEWMTRRKFTFAETVGKAGLCQNPSYGISPSIPWDYVAVIPLGGINFGLLAGRS